MAPQDFREARKEPAAAGTEDLLPQSVGQRVNNAYPAIQDPTYNKMLHTRFTSLLNGRNSAVAPLLSVDGSVNATNNNKIRGVEHSLTVQDFLIDYNVSLTV